MAEPKGKKRGTDGILATVWPLIDMVRDLAMQHDMPEAGRKNLAQRLFEAAQRPADDPQHLTTYHTSSLLLLSPEYPFSSNTGVRHNDVNGWLRRQKVPYRWVPNEETLHVRRKQRELADRLRANRPKPPPPESVVRGDVSVVAMLLARQQTQTAPAAPKPVQRSTSQNAELLAALRAEGFDPQALPPALRGGKSAAKQAARKRLLAWSDAVFLHAWKRLRRDGLLKDR